MKYIRFPEKNIPVAYQTELVILGGGPSGISAAVSAAKCGTKVLLLERYGFLGGQATGGLVIVLCGLNDKHEQIIKGYCQEVIDYLDYHKASKPWLNFIVFEPEVLKRCFDEDIKKYKINLLLHSYVVDAIIEDNNINHVLIETKNGRLAIKTKAVIDCTGDADSLIWCNEEFEKKPKYEARQVTACFRVGGADLKTINAYINDNKKEYVEIFKDFGPFINPMHWVATVDDNLIWFDMSHVQHIDITDVEDLTKAELETRKVSWEIFERFKSKIPGFEKAYIIDIAPLLGVRDSRRLRGEYFITGDDYVNHLKIQYAFSLTTMIKVVLVD